MGIITSRRHGIRPLSRFYRIDWLPERRRQVSQLSRRLVPLVLASVIAVSTFVMAISPILQQRINQNATENIATRFLNVVEGYFSPIFQFMTSASLWSRIGDLDDLGEPEFYIESLHRSLEISGSVSALSLTDASDNELVFRLDPDGGYTWYTTSPDKDDSLVAKREAAYPEYLNLSDVGEYSTLFGDYPAWFRFSVPYELPGGEGRGSTIRATLGGREADRGLRIWLDLPSSSLSDRFRSAELPDESIIFLLLPGDDFLLFSVDDLEADLDAAEEAFSRDRNLLSSILENADFDEATMSRGASIEYNGRRWRADYRDLQIGTQTLATGILVPVESLWTSGLYLPIQIVTVFILFLVIPLVLLLVRDFRNNATLFSDAELLRQLIDGGESANLEFKSSLRWDYRQEKVNKDLEGVILKTVAAFGNTSGGTLLIGVADDGRVLGLEPDYGSLREAGRDFFELHLRTVLIGQYGNDVASRNVKVSFVNLDGGDVCRLDIRRSSRPMYTTVSGKSGSSEKFYIRSGNSSRSIDTLGEITSYVVNHFGRKAVD